MTDHLTEFVEEGSGVLSAEIEREGEFIHVYHGEMAEAHTNVRFLTLAPAIADADVISAFKRVVGQWHNPSTHPNIVGVFERSDTPRPWIATELPVGQRLDAVEADLSLTEIRNVIDDAAEAIRNAALYNSTHLDLSPQHIYVDTSDDEPRALVDEWGLTRACRIAAGRDHVTPFTAPELLDEPDGGTDQTDIYGLGAVTYYALTGQPPVSGADLATAIRDGDITDPSELNPELPATVDEVVLRTLAYEPIERHDSSYAFQTAITNALPTDRERDSTGSEQMAGPEEQPDAERRPTPAKNEQTGPTDTTEPAEADRATEEADSSFSRRAALGALGIGAFGVAGWYLSPPSNPLTSQRETETPTTGTEIETPAADGIEQWTYETGDLVESSPAIVDRTVYIGSDDGNVYALSTADGTEQWAFKTGNSVESSPAVVDGTVYVGSDDGTVYALSADDGTERWAFETGGRVRSSPAVVDETVYVGSGASVYALSAADGIEQWASKTGYGGSSPAVVDGTVYVGSGASVYARSAADGTEQWAFETGNMVYTSPAVVDGTVYVGSGASVYALSAADGTEQWAFETGDSVWSSPAVVDGTVYAGSRDDNVYALSAADGTQQWVFETGTSVKSSPAVVNETVYVGSFDNTVYALSAADGTEQWAFETGGSVSSSPAVVDGTIFVGTADGTVYALSAVDGTASVQEVTTRQWPMFGYGPANTGYPSTVGESTPSEANSQRSGQEIDIQHRYNGTHWGSTRHQGEMVSSVGIDIVPTNGELFEFGGSTGLSVRVVETDSNQSITYHLSSDTNTYLTDQFAPEMNLRGKPKSEIRVRTPQRDDSFAYVNSELDGNNEIFSRQTFAPYRVELVDEDGNIVGSTESQTYGINYKWSFSQEGSRVTITRDEEVQANWSARLRLMDENFDSVTERREMSHNKRDDVFEISIDEFAVDTGEYGWILSLSDGEFDVMQLSESVDSPGDYTIKI